MHLCLALLPARTSNEWWCMHLVVHPCSIGQRDGPPLAAYRKCVLLPPLKNETGRLRSVIEAQVSPAAIPIRCWSPSCTRLDNRLDWISVNGHSWDISQCKARSWDESNTVNIGPGHGMNQTSHSKNWSKALLRSRHIKRLQHLKTIDEKGSWQLASVPSNIVINSPTVVVLNM